MAIYQFKCTSCGAREDVMRPMRLAAEPHFCTRCGSQAEREVERPAWFRPGLYGKAGGGLSK